MASVAALTAEECDLSAEREQAQGEKHAPQTPGRENDWTAGREAGHLRGMTFPELKEFLERRMQMSHIYQPLLIKCLVDAGGLATVRQLAQQFLNYDESQVVYYEKKLKEMPIPVLA